jgi:hypothetical protein
VKGRPLYVIDEAVSEIAAESTVARTGRSR